MSSVATVTSLHKVFGAGAGAVRALNGVDLDMHRGEVLLLMGPSGSGKTTLLSIIGCILRPTAGGVRVSGEDVAGLPGKRLAELRLQHIGFVFQDFNLLPTLSAVENIEIPLLLRKMHVREARRRALDALESVGLSAKGDVFPAELSGGEKQRVAIARALIGKPSLLLADEPTAALDFANGRAILNLLADSASQAGCSVVIVSHDLRAREFADRVALLEDGRLVPDGSVISAPSSM
jgi:putative ABC transport system ATP-binding protein